MEGATVIEGGLVTTAEGFSTGADAVIFQKVFDYETARKLRAMDTRVYWDMCDPSWWFNPNEVRENLQHVDGVVLSSDALKADFDQWSDGSVPSYCIPDRIKLEHYPVKRVHADVSPVRLIWFGLSVNRWAILSALANLERLVANGHKIELTIMDDVPGRWDVTDAFPIYHTPWSLERENKTIAAHDIAVLPPYPGPWGKVKSNNRTLTAWACGVPVVDGLEYDMLERLAASEWQREYQSSTKLSAYSDYFDPALSAREWEAILCA